MKELPHRLHEVGEMGCVPNSSMIVPIVILQLNTVTENHL